MAGFISDPRIFSLICVVLGGMGQGVVAPKLPDLLKNSPTLAFHSGLSAALMYLGIYVSTYRYGKLADRGYFHRLLGPGLFFYALSLLALGLVSSPISIMAIRFFEGLALSAVFVAADFALGRLSPESSRGQWLSYYGVALSIGLLLGPAFALGTQRWIGPSPSVPLLGVAAAAVLLGLFALRYRIPRAAQAKASGAVRLETRALASGAAYGYMEAALVAVFPILAVQEFGVQPEILLMVVIVSAAISSILWGVASDRIGSKPIVRFLLAFLTIGTSLLAASSGAVSGQALSFSSTIFFGMIAGGLYPVGFAWLLESVPKSQYGFASGSFARAYGLGSLAGPLIAGLTAQAFGSRGLFSAILFPALLTLLFVLRR